MADTNPPEPTKPKEKRPVGHPRKTMWPVDKTIALGKEYIKWLGENRDCVHHTEFYSIYKHILRSEWDCIRDAPEFKPYYEQARNILAKRHMQGAVKEGIAHRFLRLYLSDLREAEDKNKAYEASLKIKEAEAEAKPKTLADLKKDLETGGLSQK